MEPNNAMIPRFGVSQINGVVDRNDSVHALIGFGEWRFRSNDQRQVR
jgi:hypothetical protein